MNIPYKRRSHRGSTALSLLVVSLFSVSTIWLAFFSSSSSETGEIARFEAMTQREVAIPIESVALPEDFELHAEPEEDELTELTPLQQALLAGEVASVLERQIKRGETLSALWGEHNLPLSGAVSAQSALSESGVRTLQLGETVKIGLDAEGDIVALERTLSPVRTVVLRGDSKSGYEASFWQPETEVHRRRIEGRITSSLSEAALSLGIPYSVVDEFVDLLSDRVDFRREIQPGAQFAVIFDEKRTGHGRVVSTGTVHGVLLKNNNREHIGLRWQDDEGKLHSFDEKGELVGNFFLRYPLTFSRISSVFSEARFHPVLKRSRPHNGVDFAAPTGTPVRSVADGVVEVATFNRAAGNMIRIRHTSRYQTEYFHLSRFAKGLRKGSRVSRGEVIGYVGATGLATGPHLHFGMFRDGKYVDPMKVDLPRMPSDGVKMPEDLRRALLRELRGRRVQMARRPANLDA